MGVKRGQEGSEVASKKAKPDPLLEPVLQAIEESAKRQGVLEEACDVLLELAKGGLGTPTNERHKFQVEAVDQVSALLTLQQQALAHDLSAADDKVAAVKGEQDTIGADKSNSEALHRETATSARATKVALAEAAQRVLDLRREVNEAEVELKHVDANSLTVRKRKEAAEAALADNFGPLKEGSCSDHRSVMAHVEALSDMAQKLGLDESLVAAVKSACTRTVETRRPFDLVTLDQFEHIVTGKIAAMASELEAQGPAATQRSSAAEAKRSYLVAARSAIVEAAATYRSASAAQREAWTALEAVQRRAAALGPNELEAAKARELAQGALDGFRSSAWTCFETLRDRRAGQQHDEPEESKVAPLPVHNKDVSITAEVGLREVAIAVGGQ